MNELNKICALCKKLKKLEEFTIATKERCGRKSRCKECIKISAKKYYVENRESLLKKYKEYSDKPQSVVTRRKSFLKRTYNVSFEKIEEILKSQSSRCALCKETLTGWGKGNKTVHIDHNHSCCRGKTSCGKCVRGIICQTCNIIIGFYETKTKFFNGPIQEYLNTYK